MTNEEKIQALIEQVHYLTETLGEILKNQEEHTELTNHLFNKVDKIEKELTRNKKELKRYIQN